MELAFATRNLRLVCEDDRKAAEVFSEEVAAALRKRLADLRAAVSFQDLATGRPIVASGDSSVRFDLAGNIQLVCRPNHSQPPVESTGAVDWNRVRRLQVIAIEERAPDG